MVGWAHGCGWQEGGKALLEALQKNQRLKEAGNEWEGADVFGGVHLTSKGC